MAKAQRYDTVVLTESVNGFRQGEKGAVVEAYTMPYEAYDIEIVTDEGGTKGLVEAVRPEQIQVISPARPAAKFAAIHLEKGGSRAAISFSDGTKVTISAQELHARAA